MIRVQDLSANYKLISRPSDVSTVLNFVGKPLLINRYRNLFVRMSEQGDDYIAVWGCAGLPLLSSLLELVYLSTENIGGGSYEHIN